MIDTGRDSMSKEGEPSPGPWRLVVKDGVQMIEDANGRDLMDDERYYPSVPVSDADWHLIAAAPEMLDFIRGLEWHRYTYGGMVCPICCRYERDGHSDDCKLAAVLRKAGGVESPPA
jgi:hypothetical protein